MKRIILNTLFAIVMVVLGLVLTAAASLLFAVKVLEPRHLTPLVQKVANQMLDADVTIGRVELAFSPAFPMLRVEVDSLMVVSHAFNALEPDMRSEMPAWADSLVAFDRFSGSLDLGRLMSHGEIAVHKVELVRPAVNIALARNGVGNFDIYHSEPDTANIEEPTGLPSLPAISLDHFGFVEPRAIRYFNAADSTEATVLLLRDISLDSDVQPRYRIKIDGHLSSPITQSTINIEDVSFGLDGHLHWDPKNPGLMTFERFDLYGAFLHAAVDAAVELGTTLIVQSARVTLSPVPIEELLTFLPDDIRRANRLYAPTFRTDGAIGLEAELLAPFTPDTDSVPAARVNISMADAMLRYGAADIRKLGFEIEARTDGRSFDNTFIDIRRATIQGPATQLSLKGMLSSIMSDPAFDAVVKGKMDLRRLPPVLAAKIPGFLSGTLNLDLSAKGRASMLTANDFHRLNVDGTINGKKLYFLASDTAKMADIPAVTFNFGTKRKVGRKAGKRASMLGADVAIDTATILVDGINISLSGLSLRAATQGLPSEDTTIVVPIGGGLKVGRLNIESITDSGGVRLRDIDGQVRLRRFKGLQRVPEIIANLNLGRMGAGVPSTRLIVRDAHLEARTHMLPKEADRRDEIRHLQDSIRRSRPDLTPDSVMQLALEKRRANRGHGKKRVRAAVNDRDLEVIEWDLSKGFRRFLLGWQLNGKLTTRNARLFTPLFPLRNRINRMDIDFSNDTVRINNIRYRAGRSDIVVKGLVSNIKKGLTSKRSGNSLKLNFDITSDTIDVNQLSAAVFAGAAYSRRLEQGHKGIHMADDASDDELDRSLDALASEKPDTMGAILVPTNLDGQLSISADNIFYADMALKDLTGDILMYDGGINLHRLGASSEAGNIELSALYSAPKATDIQFGLGLDLERFDIDRFLELVPAVDSIMPIMRDFSGIIDAEIAATVDIDSTMNMVLPSLDAALRLTGDSLAFINPKTYATLGKWLRFKDRTDNTIKHINVEMVVRDNVLQIFPFAFNIDRYRLGVVGYNDLNMNFDYHIAVLKSPIPFKFGITIKGNPDKYKIRLGGAKFKEGQVAESINVVDTARVNLLQQIENVFRRGVQRSRFVKLNTGSATEVVHSLNEPDKGLSAADSLALIREGIIEAPALTPN